MTEKESITNIQSRLKIYITVPELLMKAVFVVGDITLEPMDWRHQYSPRKKKDRKEEEEEKRTKRRRERLRIPLPLGIHGQ